MAARQTLLKAKNRTVADTDRALSKAPAPTSAPDLPEKEVKRSRLSSAMLAIWEKRWAEGRSGLYGGKPLPLSVKLREKKLAKARELGEERKVGEGQKKEEKDEGWD